MRTFLARAFDGAIREGATSDQSDRPPVATGRGAARGRGRALEAEGGERRPSPHPSPHPAATQPPPSRHRAAVQPPSSPPHSPPPHVPRRSLQTLSTFAAQSPRDRTHDRERSTPEPPKIDTKPNTRRPKMENFGPQVRLTRPQMLSTRPQVPHFGPRAEPTRPLSTRPQARHFGPRAEPTRPQTQHPRTRGAVPRPTENPDTSRTCGDKPHDRRPGPARRDRPSATGPARRADRSERTGGPVRSAACRSERDRARSSPHTGKDGRVAPVLTLPESPGRSSLIIAQGVREDPPPQRATPWHFRFHPRARGVPSSHRQHA